MKKIAFVIPWYAETIPGGAEMELRGLTTHLHEAGVEVEILTTCVKEFASDWNIDYYQEGVEIIHDFKVRRFKVRMRDTEKFDRVNYKLMNNRKITVKEQDVYVKEMINSPDLYQYIAEHKDEYALFVFIPYMFGTTYYGLQVCPEKSVLIPCFHNEPYIYLDVYKPVFENVAGIIYHSQPEYQLANTVFDLKSVQQAVLGEGVYTDLLHNADAFRAKYKIDKPFLLYAGRKDEGKNVHTLLRYFNKYKKRVNNDLQLVLIGGGKISISKEIEDDVHDLGFLEIQDKYNAEAAALFLCQPSKNESFSLVIMESWLCGRPVLVHGDCDVTRNFVSESNGGLYFNNYFEFEGCVNYLLKHQDIAGQMGENGRNYVMSNFAWDIIVEKYLNFFAEIAKDE